MKARTRRLAKARRCRMARMSAAWRRDCLTWRGRVLIGVYGHWCVDWDDLPIDETTREWPCACATDLRREA